MATKTITIDTGEWLYPDRTSVTHAVTDAQTFTFDLTDGGASAVVWRQNNATSVTTTDGLRITMRPQATPSTNTTGSTNSLNGQWGPTADAQDGTAIRNLAGEFVCECPTTGVTQFWKASSLTVDNVDAPTTISGRFEDQFGNSFTWTSVTVS